MNGREEVEEGEGEVTMQVVLSIKKATHSSSRPRASAFLLLNNYSYTPLISPSPPHQQFVFFVHSATGTLQDTTPLTNNTSSARQAVVYFSEWFKREKSHLLDQVFKILHDDHHSAALSQLGLRLNESFVLQVLSYGKAKNDVLSCLKFFDWAGHQHGFRHTLATFHAIFNILSRAKLMPIMLKFLDNELRLKFLSHKFTFYSTLVMGYALAGKPMFALHLFGKMRFVGLDLDDYTYHILLNALVEESCYEAVDVVAKQIALRGCQGNATHPIILKSFCKRKLFDQAEAYLRKALLKDGGEKGHDFGFGYSLAILVDAFCKNGQLDKASQLIDELRKLGSVPMKPAYDMWLRNLVQAGKIDGALEFLLSMKSSENYVPEIFRYNTLLCRLLREDRLGDAIDLLVEMIENQIPPDMVTMNAALCFFCKAGMVDVALELYNSKSEFGLSPNGMAYNYLINALLGNESTGEAYRVLKSSMDQEYFPGRKTFTILADALCREGKLDKMKELVLFSLQRNFIPNDSIYDRLISALCRARRVEDGYLIHGELTRFNKVAKSTTYAELISGLGKIHKGDVAARLLLEMQEKGHEATRPLFRTVIRYLCATENAETKFCKLLDMQLSLHEPNSHIYKCFIDGAGHAKKPDLGRHVYEMMYGSGIKVDLSSDILMLKCYLKSGRISDALNFFDILHHRRRTIGRKVYNTMIVGLCRVNKVDLALDYFRKMQNEGYRPSIQCFEVLVNLLCSIKRYDLAIDLTHELEKVGRPITPFIGNTFLLYSLRSKELYDAWVQYREAHDKLPCNLSILGQLISTFSGRVAMHQEIGDLEMEIQRCFPVNVYTFNILLSTISKRDIDYACEMFSRMQFRGYEPNQGTYGILINGLSENKRTAEAERLRDEMFRKGLIQVNVSNN
ncbi:hypothetical protein K2173_008755 [Erythroxylum novogranatense]|uniref:Pentatricopeptide repeat-containing protein n=1 Tax=Erythroxylum novogranatense TaxID=1862640 RepID=A0AAV8S5Y3_9ROSI|nr:hypothetical protein K2173_008755 [Erythroxylum novogranatense]